MSFETSSVNVIRGPCKKSVDQRANTTVFIRNSAVRILESFIARKVGGDR